jgi:hypothetical protein
MTLAAPVANASLYLPTHSPSKQKNQSKPSKMTQHNWFHPSPLSERLNHGLRQSNRHRTSAAKASLKIRIRQSDRMPAALQTSHNLQLKLIQNHW